MIKECVIHVRSDGGNFVISPYILTLRPDGTPAEPFEEGRLGTEVSVGGELSLKSKSIKLHGGSAQPGDHEEMWVFCAADKHKPYTGRVQPGVNRISLEVMENGGSVVFPRGAGHVPDFHGRIEVFRETINKIHIRTMNFTINGDQDRSMFCEINQPVTMHSRDNRAIRFTVKGMIARSVIAEYERIVPPLGILSESDDWEPLPIDRGNPLHEQAVEALEAATKAIREDNGYAANKPEERSRVLGILEPKTEEFKTESSIPKRHFREIVGAIILVAGTFTVETVTGGLLAFAQGKLVEWARVAWDWVIPLLPLIG